MIALAPATSILIPTPSAMGMPSWGQPDRRRHEAAHPVPGWAGSLSAARIDPSDTPTRIAKAAVMTFRDDLRQFGPDASSQVSRQEARAYCARLTARHYENFSVVTWLTPRPLRPAFQSVYAFCRWSDDLGDEVGDPARARQLLAWWRGELRAMYEGRARHPVMVALAETVAAFAI